MNEVRKRQTEIQANSIMNSIQEWNSWGRMLESVGRFG